MLKKVVRTFKKLVIFVLIVTMVTPSVIIPADIEPPWDTLPEIEPYTIDPAQTMTREISDAITEEPLINLADIDIYDGLDPAVIDEILRQQENAWLQEPSVQQALRFYELVNSPASYSSLSQDDRNLILQQLNIAEAAYSVANELFLMMERNRHSLSQSIDLMVIMSSGLFNYDEAKDILAHIPSTIERNTEIMRFQQFTLGFDIPTEVRARRLTNRHVVDEDTEHRREFADISMFLPPGSTHLQYSFIETAQMELGYYYEYIYEEYPDWQAPEEEEEALPPETEELPEDEEDYLPEPEEEPPTDEEAYTPELEETPEHEMDIPEHEEPFAPYADTQMVSLASVQYASFYEEQFDIFLPEASYPEPEDYTPTQETRPTRPSRPTTSRRSRIGRDNAIRTRPWMNRSQETPEYLAARTAISNAFTNQYAFNVAHQMFMDNRGVAEIETAFAIGAALQVEPETFMLPPDMYRAASTEIFAEENSIDAFAAASAFSFGSEYTIPPLTPTPQPPTPPTAVQDMAPAMEYPFDVGQVMREIDAGEEEIEYLVEYGLEIITLGITPATTSAPLTHDDIINSPFGLHFNANESVNLNTGAAMYRTNVLSLPGRGGFGLNLDLVYNSADADIGMLSFREVLVIHWCPICWGMCMDWCRLFNPPFEICSIIEHRERNNPHGLAVGWKFDLPYISNNILYIPGRGSFVLDGNSIQDYSLEDMRLVNDTTFISGPDRVREPGRVPVTNTGNVTRRSTRRLTFHDGTSYFFYGTNTRSYILGKRDRFGNTIYFEYGRHFNNDLLRLSTIIDSNQKRINFSYRVANNNYIITITGPDDSTFEINMSPQRGFTTPSERELRNMFRLDSIRNQVGAVTSFAYDHAAFYYCWTTKNPTWARSFAFLLRQVTYPSGAQLRFNYGWRTINLGRIGSRQSFMVTSRELFSNGRSYQHTTFSYQGDHTAFPHQVDRLPSWYTYSTTVTQNNGLRTVYTFIYRHLNTLQRTYNASNVLLSNQRISYNADRLPINITLTEYSGGLSRTLSRSFGYNQFGQVTTAISPLATGRVQTQYRTTTTYDNRFGLSLTTTFMSDANTTIRHVNRLSGDGRSIVGTDIYENNVRQSRTNFLHDAHGNVTEIREFPNANGSDFIQTQITYAGGTMPSSVRTLNVRYPTGALLGRQRHSRTPLHLRCHVAGTIRNRPKRLRNQLAVRQAGARNAYNTPQRRF